MQRLLLFFYQYRAFILFIILEILSIYFIIENNKYQNASYYNTSSEVAGWTLNTTREVKDYFSLQEVNDQLAKDNAYLRTELQKYKYDRVPLPDQLVKDSILLNQFTFQSAKVINNSITQTNNYLTINKGIEDGIKSGMGVISGNGVVGKIKYTSKHYSTVTSVLHSDVLVSSVEKSSGTLCSTKWDGKDATVASLLYVPRHIKVKIGDTILTSAYNAIYPEGLMVGRIKSKELKPNSPFWDIQIQLYTDFSRLSYVLVVKNKLLPERDSLEKLTSE